MENRSDETMVETKIAEMEQALTAKDTELAEANERMTALQNTLLERESELAAARKTTAEAEARLSAAGGELAEAVKGYRTLILQANPGVTEDMVPGDTISTINEALAKARTLIGRVRQSVETEIARGRVPIGSPGRQSQDIASLSPREKINYAIGGKK
jgi:uncharacterized coiled-coil protein SlyX